MQDILIFITGFHTSAYYLTTLFWYLARNDHVQEKLHEEIEKEVGDDCGDLAAKKRSIQESLCACRALIM